ncbi:cytochrome c3 family protein [uncultured Desulfuromusa sp.]|uniref:cytochrome c3 family protein n=1 Tax=uncultured Desulfuromusa sp. TaxID=219183 RepID=UPI002AA8F60B|nr:cytochrome c3 family protein [uncultured Desulfuromusa sp.]
MKCLSAAGKITVLSCFMILVFIVDSSAETCSTSDCHAELAQLAYSHSPVAEGDCSSCHEQVQEQHPIVGGKSFQRVENGARLCYQCHDKFGRKLTVHSPVAEGDCLDCHDPHGSNVGPALLPVDHNLTELCINCHDADLFTAAYGHGPAVAGACTQCHNPHESNQSGLLKKTPQKLCTSCHEEIADGMENAPIIHAAVEDSSCTTCHNPHSAPAAKLLSQDVESLCMDCHRDVGVKAQKAKVKHAALYRPEKCSGCHSAHFSQYPALLSLPEKDVCLSCHGQDDYSKSEPLNNIAKEIQGKRELHRPLADGECSACHNPHGSDNTRMLFGAYPKSFYHPYTKGSYDFCLQCHDKNLLRFAETTIYTEFRNGKQNLHYLHVANKYKGRSCRACHEPHAANSEKLMSEEGAEFGDWRIPTRFVKTASGGSCSPGCHQVLEYDRENPVDYQK